MKQEVKLVGVTGGDGFIGSRLKQRLINAAPVANGGRSVLITDWDRSKGGDILDAQLAKIYEGCEVVIHLAGVLGTAELFDHPDEAIDVNIKGTLRVLDACHKVGARYIGITMPDIWQNVYQATKRCARDLAEAWAIHFGLHIAHVRAYNVFGEGQKVSGVQKIVPTFATKAWRGEPLPVWGTGAQMVDLIYVDDVADILARLSEVPPPNGSIVEAGTGWGLTVENVANMVNEITGNEAGIQYLPMRKGEDLISTPIAQKEGWRWLENKPEFRYPQLERTVQWYKDPRP